MPRKAGPSSPTDKKRQNPMKKDAIIDLLENDLKEMHTLVETFREPDRIASAFLELLQQKHDSLAKEIKLLDYWATENMTQPSGATLTGRTGPHVTKQGAAKEAEQAPATNAAPARSDTKPSDTQAGTDDYFASEMDDIQDLSGLLADIARPQSQAAQPASRQDGAPLAPAQKQESEQAKPAQASDATPSESTQKKEKEEPQSQAQKAADIANYGTPVDDINKAMGINDRFLFLRELFKGNKMAFDTAVETVNMASSYTQAYSYLRQTFGWDETDPTAEAFLKAVHRRFL